MKLRQSIRLGGFMLLMASVQSQGHDEFHLSGTVEGSFGKAPITNEITLDPCLQPESSFAGVADQLKVVRSMGDNIGPEEVGRFYSFLKSKGDEHGYKPPGIYALKNELMNVLRKQSTPLEGLTDLLISLFDDANQDPVVRDYAIQHLVAWCAQNVETDDGAKSKSRDALLRAASKQSAIAGTALLGWHRLSAVDLAFGRQWIDESALKFARSNETIPAVRIAALQVCAERHLYAVLPEAEVLARTSSNIGLRVSAIAALGHLGGETQASMLRGMISETEAPWQTAVQAALRRLSQKTEVPDWNPKSS